MKLRLWRFWKEDLLGLKTYHFVSDSELVRTIEKFDIFGKEDVL